jgi:hypothetical protein
MFEGRVSMENAFRERLVRLLGVVALPVLGFVAVDAHAGNLWLTGHDMDFHCTGGAGCNNFGIAVDFIRQGAPTKTLPILVLDEGGQVVAALGQAATKSHNTVEGAGNAFPTVVIAPSSAAFATATINTATYSAVIIASDQNCGGCDNTPASITAINARTAALQAFFTAGGGLMYLAGALDPGYYDSVPVPATAVAVSPPFTVQPPGAALGLTTAEANCCATHNSFNLPPPGSPLQVAETDTTGKAETLFAAGSGICGGALCGGGAGVAVPTLSDWALVTMGALLLLVGAAFLRRRSSGRPAA